MANKHSLGTRIKQISAAIIAVLTIIVVLQNTETVHTKVLFGTISMPRAMLLAFTFSVGVLVGTILSYYWNHRKSAKDPSGDAIQD